MLAGKHTVSSITENVLPGLTLRSNGVKQSTFRSGRTPIGGVMEKIIIGAMVALFIFSLGVMNGRYMLYRPRHRRK